MNGDDFHIAVEELAAELEANGMEYEAYKVRSLTWIASQMIRDFLFYFSIILGFIPLLTVRFFVGYDEDVYFVSFIFFLISVIASTLIYWIGRLILRFHTARRWPRDNIS